MSQRHNLYADRLTGETVLPADAPRPSLGESIRALIRYRGDGGGLFGGAIVSGVVGDMRGPISHIDPSGRPILGTPIHDAGATLYCVHECTMDGRPAPSICLANREIIFLVPREDDPYGVEAGRAA